MNAKFPVWRPSARTIASVVICPATSFANANPVTNKADPINNNNNNKRRSQVSAFNQETKIQSNPTLIIIMSIESELCNY